MAAHRIGREVQTHRRWDVGLEPVLRVQPGDLVTAETDDFAGGQITRSSTASELLALDLDAIYPLAGPVAIEGAEAGDTISIEILDFELPDWGWACVIPGLGLLPPGEFSEPYIRHFDLTGGVTAELCPGVQIPIEPFCGTMGVPGPGMRGVPIPVPHAGGGNIDNRHLTRGATLYLPVSAPGGLFSVGDAHAAQGDGEVAISGLECAMATTYRVGLLKGAEIPAPQIRKPAGSLTPRVDGAGWYATSGIEPDLLTAAQVAVRAMIEHLGRERGLGREDAYMLCSLAGDLKITEVVDAPNWMVSCFLPDAVFVS